MTIERLAYLVDTLEELGLISEDCSYEEFEAAMEKLDAELKELN